MSNPNNPIIQLFAAFQKIFYGGAVCGEKQAAPVVGGPSPVKKLYCRKAHTFTVEAMLGALLFIMVISAITAYANPFRENGWTVPEEKLADDVLIVLEKTGTLSTLNETLMENDISGILGNSSSFSLEMRTYNYSKGAMKHLKTTDIGDDPPDGAEIAVAERGFFSTDGGSITNYTIARLSLWK